MFVASLLNEKSKKKRFVEYKLEDLNKFKKVLKKTDVLGVESTTNTRYFVKEVKDRVKEVKVINTRQFKVISDSVKKTDKNDAERIAIHLSKDRIPEVRMKAEKLQEVESLAQTRDRLVKLRTSLKNKIHNLLSSQGIISKRESLSSEKGLKRVLGYGFSEGTQLELEVIVDQIRHLNEGIKRIDEKLEELGKKLKGHKNLTSIKGIGPKSASVLLSVIGEINDFADAKKLSSYFGIVPRVNNSNETIRHGRITKQGSKLGRTTLVQCTLIAIRYSDYLKSYYQKLKAKKGSGKAIIATSKKMLGIIYKTLKNNWVFEDFPNFVLAA